MKGATSKETAPPVIAEKERGPFPESAFFSRFAPGQTRREALAWIAVHFPSWVEEAKRQADLALGGIDSESDAVPRQKWKERVRERTRSLMARELPDRMDRDFLWDSADRRLSSLAKGYWYTGRRAYADAVLAELDRYFQPRTRGKSASSPGGSPLAGVWILRFLGGAHEETKKLEFFLLKEASRVCRRSGRESAVKGLFLLMMGTLYPEYSEADFWKGQGIKILERELFRKVGRDGICRSKSLSDQTGLLSLYLQALLLGRRFGAFTERAERRIEKMLEFLPAQREHALLARAGERPLFSFQGDESDPISTLLGIGAIVFGRSDLGREAASFSEEAFFLAGIDGYLFHREKEAPEPAGAANSLIFDEAGYAVLASAAADETDQRKLIFRSEAISPFATTGEASPLSFSIFAPAPLFMKSPELLVRGRSIEPPSLYGRLIGAQRRNGEWKSPFPRFFLGEEVDYVEGEQELDHQRQGALRQKRAILFIKPSYWVVHDLFSGDGDFDAEAIFPFSPDATIEGNRSEGFRVFRPGSSFWTVPLGTHLEGIEAEERQTEKRLLIRNSGRLPASMTTVFYPEKEEGHFRHDFKSLYFPSIERGTAFELLNAACTDTLIVSPPSGQVALSSLRFEGELLFVRRDYLGEIARVFALSSRRCYWEGKLLFESARPFRFLELSYRGEVLHMQGDLSGPISLYADGVEEIRMNGRPVYFTRDRGRLVLHL